jgi:hypothetical protein
METIKASELRIGNRIYYEYFDIETREWKQKPINVTYREIYILLNGGKIEKFVYQPIPTTEAWLFKFGFKRSSFGWIKSGMNLTPGFTLGFSSKRRSIDLKFVHQVQNLYFALTGEELI